MKCKWCGAEVELGKRCEYCGSIAEPFYYGVNPENIHNYAAGSHNKVYGWEVSTVKEYEKPMALEALGIKRAPQSWQYVR